MADIKVIDMQREAVLVPTFFVIVLIAVSVAYKPMPKKYGTAVPRRELDTTFLGTRKKIVLYHNYFRAQVDPPAKDMLEMKWFVPAAEDAQRWAEACELLVHDNVTGRWVDNYGSCGQNIFVANMKVPWFFAVKTWFMEKLNFTYEGDNDLEIVGHYTQLVWYSSHKVGCGFHYCANSRPKPYYNYVCNYCPIGNYPERIAKPYGKGTPCGNCEDSCKFKKLCTNACPYADLWMNCRQLNNTWHDWLCKSEHEASCLATCRCGEDKIK